MKRVCVSITSNGTPNVQGPEELRENPILGVTLKPLVMNSVVTLVVSVHEIAKVLPGRGWEESISVGPLTLKYPVIAPVAFPLPVTVQTGVTLGEKKLGYVDVSWQDPLATAAVLCPANDTRVPAGPAPSGAVSHSTWAWTGTGSTIEETETKSAETRSTTMSREPDLLAVNLKHAIMML